MPEHVGLLLAAGRGSRFDPSGRLSKLLQTLPDGRPVALAAAQALLPAISRVIALVPADDEDNAIRLAELLNEAGCDVIACPAARYGMGHTLAAGVAASASADGWLVLPGDMPWVTTTSCLAVAAALSSGAAVAAPNFQGLRGHPVGFAAGCRQELLALSGDMGARALLARYPLTTVEVDDGGVVRDVDMPGDLV